MKFRMIQNEIVKSFIKKDKETKADESINFQEEVQQLGKLVSNNKDEFSKIL